MKDKRPDSNYNVWQLKTGTKIEMEHTSDKALAKKIAKDHLDEFPDYYTHLVRMERELKEKKYPFRGLGTREHGIQPFKKRNNFGGVF